LSPHIFQIHTHVECGWAIAATPHTCDNDSGVWDSGEREGRRNLELVAERRGRVKMAYRVREAGFLAVF
jgi:hypothetical protein